MKKLIAILLSAFMLAAVFAGCGDTNGGKDNDNSTPSVADTAEGSEENTGGGTINLFTWAEMFPQEVLDAFTAETGISINYVNFDTDENMLAKLQTEKGGTYDVIIADDYILETVIAEGLAQKLDKDKLSHYGSIDPVYQGQFFDKDDEYTVPYGAGIQTIVYDPALTGPITSYADLFREDLKDSVGVIGNYRVVNGMGLKILGESYNTEDVAVIEQAGEKMKELAPNVRVVKDDNMQDDLIAGEISAAVMYTSNVTIAKIERPDLEMVFPEEGIGFGVMAKFIPVNAPNADGAHKFIDYILTPEVSAECYEYLGYYCTNKDASGLISEEYKEFLTLPEDVDLSKMEMIGNISAEASDTHDKVWIEFKTACGAE